MAYMRTISVSIDIDATSAKFADEMAADMARSIRLYKCISGGVNGSGHIKAVKAEVTKNKSKVTP